jgi:hypothetical protein
MDRIIRDLGREATKFDGGAYADSRSNVLADLMMSFYEDDIRPSLPEQRPITPGIDEAAHQYNIVTYRKLCP